MNKKKLQEQADKLEKELEALKKEINKPDNKYKYTEGEVCEVINDINGIEFTRYFSLYNNNTPYFVECKEHIGNARYGFSYNNHKPLNKKLGLKLWIGTNPDNRSYLYEEKPDRIIERFNIRWDDYGTGIIYLGNNFNGQTWDDDIIEVNV